MMISKKTFLLPAALTLMVVAISAAIFMAISAIPRTPVEKYVSVCSSNHTTKTGCQSTDSIRQVFGFDVLVDIEATYSKMKKTAQDIAKERLSDEAYEACLKTGECAPVPMLGPHDNPDGPKAKEISNTFWQLADGKRLTPEICAFIPSCATALKSGAVAFVKKKLVPAPPVKP